MNYILFDDSSWMNLLPLTFTRPVCEIRVGILTMKERYEKLLNSNTSYRTQDYLGIKFGMQLNQENLLLNSCLVANDEFLGKALSLRPGQSLVKENRLLACRLSDKEIASFDPTSIPTGDTLEYTGEIILIDQVWKIFQENGKVLENDFHLITKGRISQPYSDTNKIMDPSRVFIEEGVHIECAILNPAGGYIYLAKGSEIMEGTMVRGSMALGEHSTLKLGTKIYGPTTIGPHCKIGGEVNNSVVFGFSNKAHDGFLGNSVIGEWCNLGADTNNSNLKNNYAEVKLWNYASERFAKTGLQFCGLIMGDHSKCGINTMFNTGTVVGVSANIFGDGFPRNFIPSFSWGGASGFTVFATSKAFEVASKVMERRQIEFSDVDKSILEHIFETTAKYRTFQ
jgi:UDP-N-acetylglucosamine diphosphorylase/glucosamine-1-phosphate N-acetyltransferase